MVKVEHTEFFKAMSEHQRTSKKGLKYKAGKGAKKVNVEAHMKTLLARANKLKNDGEKATAKLKAMPKTEQLKNKDLAEDAIMFKDDAKRLLDFYGGIKTKDLQSARVAANNMDTAVRDMIPVPLYNMAFPKPEYN